MDFFRIYLREERLTQNDLFHFYIINICLEAVIKMKQTSWFFENFDDDYVVGFDELAF